MRGCGGCDGGDASLILTLLLWIFVLPLLSSSLITSLLLPLFVSFASRQRLMTMNEYRSNSVLARTSIHPHALCLDKTSHHFADGDLYSVLAIHIVACDSDFSVHSS
eukprot:1104476_1